uniref:Uncharacterized protein n=1 Tax=Arundo donax TaxID=35708 RepID=A0A0A9CNA8_ARUDO
MMLSSFSASIHPRSSSDLFLDWDDLVATSIHLQKEVRFPFMVHEINDMHFVLFAFYCSINSIDPFLSKTARSQLPSHCFP